jgi:hypothetical protein
MDNSLLPREDEALCLGGARGGLNADRAEIKFGISTGEIENT